MTNTLQDTIRLIQQYAIEEPSVNMVMDGSVYQLSNIKDAKYGVICITQSTHRAYFDDDYITYGFNIFYIDRLKKDQSNHLEIQTIGHYTLLNILKRMREETDFVIGEVSFYPFTERFSDDCAGIYATIEISISNDYCWDKENEEL